MAAGIPRPSSIENVSTTLSSGITDVATSVDVADASNLVSPCYLVIDRVDSAGVLKATTYWEYIKVTNIVSNTLTVTRGVNGSTNQAHIAGAIVEAVVTSAMFEDWYAVLNPEHDSAGGHVVIGTMTVAGMNLASVATIASLAATTGTITTLGTSTATIGTLLLSTATVTGGLNASGASVVMNFPTTPVFVSTGALAGATVLIQSPAIMPRGGNWKYANFWTRTVASGVSAIIDLNLNGTSMFDTIGRPMIAAGGTFASTASILTKAFNQGDRISLDYDGTGGSITDISAMLVSV